MQTTDAQDLVTYYDVVVVGGGAAGLGGALILGRSRRSVLVVDAGDPRNAPASAVHGFLTRDGTDPAALLKVGREEVRSYSARRTRRAKKGRPTMNGEVHGGGGGSEAERFWEGHYRGRDRVWSGRPNPVLVDVVRPLAPGAALDLGCGEGGDAVWLAGRGWRVSAVDVSATALERASALAAEARGGPNERGFARMASGGTLGRT